MKDIEEPNAWGSCEIESNSITEIRFLAGRVESLSPPALVGLIAHELAHCHWAILDCLFLFELDANQLMIDWGFWPELDALALSSRTDWPSRAASRRKILTGFGTTA